jgi:hypothetical protein
MDEEVTRYLRSALPSGMVVTLIVPEPEPAKFSTYVTPTSFIPFSTPEELAAQARESRDEAAAKVLAVLQEQKPQARKRRLPRPPAPDLSYGRIPYSIEWEWPA